jgi:hypothetical protein
MEQGDRAVNRRDFLLSSAKFLSALALPALPGCRRAAGEIPFSGTVAGPSYRLGHRLLEGRIPPVSQERKVPVVILGGGIAGLCAGWKLNKSGFRDFEILEIEPEAGGVSRSGENSITPYPWGAHYVPLPTRESRAVRELFRDLGVIENPGAEGRTEYREEHLCFSPQERLYIHGKWQEGFLPLVGSARADLDQFEAFREIVLEFKQRRGKDGKKTFAIPMELSSRDPALLALDRISMLEFLRRRGLDSTPLHWYVNYGCRDDYGCHYSQVSAWAGLHYYCSRGGEDDGGETAVLTWPEGNGWIVKKLEKMLRPRILTGCLAYRVENGEREVRVEVYDASENASIRIRAEEVICAIPRTFARRIMADERPEEDGTAEFHYAPWLVGNLTLKSPPLPGPGAPLAWDNVLYDSPSLGYVVATHQGLGTHLRETVLTYYYALADGPPARERVRLLRTGWKEWAGFILKDLSRAHPEIGELVTRLDLFLWGHAMVQPRVGFLWGRERREAARPRGRVHFAHSDLSGFSLFEEAQYRGVLAAERVLRKIGVPFSSSL